MKVNGRKKEAIPVLISVFLLIWCQREIVFVSKGFGNRILEVLFTLCMTVVLTTIINYLFVKKEDGISNKILFKYYALLFTVQTVAFLPMYTQNFMYGDDLWSFASDFDGTLSRGIYYSRPFIGFLKGMLPNGFLIKSFRIYNGLTLGLFGCVLFRFLTLRMKNYKWAFGFSALAITGCFAVDCIAYASVYPIHVSLLISAVSFIVYGEAKKSFGKSKIVYLGISAICLFTAFCMYQIGTPVVFLFYLISEKWDYEKKSGKRFKDAFSYLIFYGMTAVLYMIVAKILQFLCGVSAGQSARGEIFFSLRGILGKAWWFIGTVFPETLSRLLSVFTGNVLFKENNLFYGCTYVRGFLGTILVLSLLMLMIISICFNAYKQKSFMYVVLAIVAIPLSFWPFLVLRESNNLTYYALGIILLFGWYVWDGIGIIVKQIVNKSGFLKKFIHEKTGEIVFVIIAVAVLQSNNYAENTWVNYCRDSYEYLANTISARLQQDDSIHTIVVKGSISPYVGGRDYVIFAVENILTELQYNPDDFSITQRSNDSYITTFNDGEVGYMEQVLGEKTMEQLLEYYCHDDLYNRWYYAGDIVDDAELGFLRDCFIKTGQIAVEGEGTVIIRMDGFNVRNPF